MSTQNLTAKILIVSDTASDDASTDKCGPTLREVFESDDKAQFAVAEVKIVPDDIPYVQNFIRDNSDGSNFTNLIITCGGTGFAVRDTTPEAVNPLLHRHAPGLVHGMLAASLQVTPFAMMSRPVAGVRHRTLIITLPGSPKGAKENLEAILKLLPHACVQAAGADSRQIHQGGVKQLEQDAGVDQPKRGLSAYMFFANEHREKIRAEIPNIRFGEIGKTLGERWKALSQKEKDPYEYMAAADRQRYEAEKVAFASRGVSQHVTAPTAGNHQHDHHHYSHSHGHGRGYTHSHGHGHSHAAGHGGHKIPVAHTSQESHPQSNDPNAGPSRRYRTSPYPMLEVNDVLRLIQEHTPTAKTIKVPVTGDLVGSVLAEDVKAVESVPAFRASIVDGYAIKVPESGKFSKGVYPVAIISTAQAADVAALSEGTIARITTGAPLPPGANAVIMVEDTVLTSRTEDEKEEKEVEILTDEVQPSENLREVGSDVEAGAIILKKGEGITAIGGELGLLASTGVHEVLVYQKPVVGVLSTGDEIIRHDRQGELRLGEVRDTNRPTLLTAIKASGFEVADLGIASDKPGALEESLRTAFSQVDVLITTGGVSMGELDLLKPTIERTLGGTIHFGRVNMKPGKPTTFGSVPLKDSSSGNRVSKLIFSLPGNPASAVVCYHLFVLPSLHHASGITPAGLPRITVVLEDRMRCDKSRPEYHRVVVVAKRDGVLYATSTGMQRSSRIGSFKSANALLCLPARTEPLAKGEKVEALLMGRIVSDFAA